jgi:hypothetical protein
MTKHYEVPELHEVGTAADVVQSTKDPNGNDGASGPLRLDVLALNEED